MTLSFTSGSYRSKSTQLYFLSNNARELARGGPLALKPLPELERQLQRVVEVGHDVEVLDLQEVSEVLGQQPPRAIAVLGTLEARVCTPDGDLPGGAYDLAVETGGALLRWEFTH